MIRRLESRSDLEIARAIVDRLHCVGGIDDQIENDLLNLNAITPDVGQRSIEVDLQDDSIALQLARGEC